jgi:hypothetical protein
MQTDNLPIGVLAAQAIGSCSTQSSLNTSHTAGGRNFTGISRLEEIFNNSVSMALISFSFSNKIPNAIAKNIIDVSSTIKLVACEELCKELPWLHEFETKFSRVDLPKVPHVLFKIVFLVTKMLQSEIEFDQIINIDFGIFEPVAMSPCFFLDGEIVFELVLVLEYSIEEMYRMMCTKLPASISPQNLIAFFIHQIWLPYLQHLRIKGIDNVIDQYEQDGKTIVIGTNNIDMISLLQFDPITIVSTRYQDLLKIYGIEVCKKAMMLEIEQLLPDVQHCHVRFIVYQMTWGGHVDSISRYTARTLKDPLKKMSFEETIRNFCISCTTNEIELFDSATSKFVASKRMTV